MKNPKDPPPELEALDRRLSEIRFQPRASLGPEILGRARRGEMPGGRRIFSWHARSLAALAASLLLLVGLGLYLRPTSSVVVDRCCYDLDGGGVEDDGVLIVAERDAQVHRLRVYEDRDHSRHSSPGDVVRLDRGGSPAMRTDPAEGLVTTRHCCIDLDGGGPSDDALLVIGVPPDRVVMAAIYEDRPGGPRRQDHDLPLR
ncbi:MAG TPA: hypothetical protein VJQ44_17715 [Gemmatimonadales bacterium]|nr:hypothetical protein [Gemmatimonadales bacterium]